MKPISLNPAFSRHPMLTAAIATLLSAASVWADNNWDGGGADNNWNTAANWGADALPNWANAITFKGTTRLTANNNLTADAVVGGITFDGAAGPFVLSGNSITLGNGITSNSANTQTINLNMKLSGGRDITSNNAAGQIVITGTISETVANSRIRVTGIGSVLLNGTQAHTYTGATAASGNGTLILDLSNIAGNSNLVNTVSSLSLGNGNDYSGSTIVIKGASTGASSQTMKGFVLESGTAGLVKIDANGGAGTTLTLSTTTLGSANNTNSRKFASTVVFDISSPGAVINGSTTTGAGVYGLTAANQTTDQQLYGFALVKDAVGTGFAANVGGSLVRYTGAATLPTTGLVGTTNYKLDTSGSTTTLSGSGAVNTLDLTATSAGTLDLGGGTLTLANGALATTGNSDAVAGGGILAQGSGRTTIANGQLGAANQEVITHVIGTGGLEISSNISSGGGSYVKSGAGDVYLSGSNTFTGQTTILEGRAFAGSTTAFSAGSTLVLANKAGVSANLNGFDVTIGDLAGGGGIGGGLNLGANRATIGGKNSTIVHTSYNGVISGTGGITKVGTGALSLFGNNTYTGATIVNSGSLRARNGGNFGSNSAATVASGAILEIWGNNITIGSLSGAGTVSNGSGTNTLSVGSDNTSTTFSGSLANYNTTYGGATNSVMNVTKVGAGELTLSGANTYTGNTVVSTGTLTLDTTGSLTLQIRANGQNSAISGAGILNLNGAFNFDLAIAAATGTWNVVNVGTLNETYGSNFHVNDFTNAGNGQWTKQLNGSLYTFNQTTGILSAVAIPEPSVAAVMGVGLLGLAFRRNRRKH